MDNKSSLFINRELSWLSFNHRVLQEAFCQENPLLSRLRFLAISAGNLDEFFMVRISGLRKLIQTGRQFPDPAGLMPERQLGIAHEKIAEFIKSQQDCLKHELIPALAEEGICICRFHDLPEKFRKEAVVIFENRIKPILTPRVIDFSQPFPFLSSGAVEIAVLLRSGDGGKTLYALVEIPEILERFVLFEDEDKCRYFVPAEDIVSAHIGRLFAGCSAMETLLFRVTRDMDFSIADDSVEDLLYCVSELPELRGHRAAIRLETAQQSSCKLFHWLREAMELEKDFCCCVDGFLHLKSFMELIDRAERPDLLEKEWGTAKIPELPDHLPVMDAVSDAGTIMLALPYHSFSPVLRMLEEAADDPDVLVIKQTLYRVSGNSPVVQALRRAAENGKKVTVIVEVKARFDEINNIHWAQALEKSGAHVVYGIPGLKIHCKALLIVKREKSQQLKRYIHISTGNYNDRTAQQYTDIGVFSDEEFLARDIEELFNTITGYTEAGGSWQKIAVSPFSLREKFSGLIEREIENAVSGGSGSIRAKMNSLSDPLLIKQLHRAVEAGVRVELMVRGICCMRPGKSAENLRIISIVDRYLEHSRIFEFGNDGVPEYYLSSADWMPRNLDRRIELLFPVGRKEHKNILKNILDIHFTDDCKARMLLPDGSYYVMPRGGFFRSQKQIWKYFTEQGENKR